MHSGCNFRSFQLCRVHRLCVLQTLLNFYSRPSPPRQSCFRQSSGREHAAGHGVSLEYCQNSPVAEKGGGEMERYSDDLLSLGGPTTNTRRIDHYIYLFITIYIYMRLSHACPRSSNR